MPSTKTISSWDTSTVRCMRDRLAGAIAFHQDLSSWDTSHVISMCISNVWKMPLPSIQTISSPPGMDPLYQFRQEMIDIATSLKQDSSSSWDTPKGGLLKETLLVDSLSLSLSHTHTHKRLPGTMLHTQGKRRKNWKPPKTPVQLIRTNVTELASTNFSTI